MTERSEVPRHVAETRAQAMVVGWIHAEQFDPDRTTMAALALLITKALMCPCCCQMMLDLLSKHEVTGTQLSKSLDVPDGTEPAVWHDQVNVTYRCLQASLDTPAKELS